MLAGTSRARLGIFRRQTTKSNEQLAMSRQVFPGRMRRQQPIHIANNVRHQHAAGAQAVTVHAEYVTAKCIQKAMQLALRVMEASGTAPAVASAENRRIAMFGLDPLQLVGDQIERHLPRHFNKGLLPTRRWIRTCPGQVTTPHCRSPNTRW